MNNKKNEKLVETFNKLFPVGSSVMHRKNATGDFEPRIVRSEAYIASSGDPVAFFEDLSGYYCITSDFVLYK